MNKINPQVNTYFSAGCGRCNLTNTPECKVHNWDAELAELRKIVLKCGVDEELKWGVPCYTFNGKNVFIISAFKDYCSISFFKGSLLKDDEKVLIKQGENSNAGRLIKFTDVQRIVELKTVIKSYIYEAVELEKSGAKVVSKSVSEYEFPIELQNKFDENEAFKNAFLSLTLGRQKGYLIHFAQPKQSKTRVERIEKCLPKIMSGKGLNDDYLMRK